MNKQWIRQGAALVCAAVLLLIGCVGCGGQKGTVRVRLCEVTHSIFYAPQYVALAQGFFLDEGLEVELSNGQGADAVMAAVLSGNIDIGFAGPEASIYVYNEGKEDFTQVFAQVTRRDGSFLLGRQPDSAFTWDKVKGKTVLPGRKGGVPYMALEHVLRQNGIDPAKATTLDNSVQYSMMTAALVGAAAGEIPYTAYFAKKSYIEKNSELIQKFTNALYRGQQWVQTHTAAEIAAAVQDSFPDTDLALLEKAVESYRSIDAWNDTPVMTEENFNRLQSVMTEAGELTKIADYGQVVNNTYARKAIETVK